MARVKASMVADFTVNLDQMAPFDSMKAQLLTNIKKQLKERKVAGGTDR
jgi:hypothetical protein